MNARKSFTRMIAGVAVFGMALCVPAAMLAQDAAPAAPPQGTAGQQPSPGERPMRHRHPPNAHRQLHHLTKMLNLTPDQQKQMLPILQDQHKRMRSIHDNAGLSPQERRQQMRSAMMETHQKLQALMTDSQKQQFKQTMQQRRERMQNRRGMGLGRGEGAGAPSPPNGQNSPPPPPQ